ncbi:MAG: hypothetical protein J7L14_01710 [Candidatus Diapherotrites archaeon]|nr:hypothetical protein [Candidatus Diapherotrites archaeon]
MPRGRHAERRRSEKRLYERSKANAIISLTTTALKIVNSNREFSAKTITKAVTMIKRKLDERRKTAAERIEKAKLSKYSVIKTENTKTAIYDKILITNYPTTAEDLIKTVANYSKAGMPNLRLDEPNHDELKPVFRMYYTSSNADEIHSTMAAVRITPFTLNTLYHSDADFYIITPQTRQDISSQYVQRTSPVYHVLELLSRLLRTKSRRERHTRKRKGHYGILDENERIHLVYTNWFEEKYTYPLKWALNDGYFMRIMNAHGVGLPERAGRLGFPYIVAIVGRKGKWTKRYGDKKERWTVYERSQSVKGKY